MPKLGAQAILHLASPVGRRELLRKLQVRLRLREPLELEVLAAVRRLPWGRPASVLEGMERLGGRAFLMHLGPEKGALLDDVVRSRRPDHALELGAYCGYSAVRLGALLAGWGGRVTSVELDGRRAGVAREVVAHAGLGEHVHVVEGTLAQALPGLGAVDLVLMDHAKEAYLPDLLLLEGSGALGPGAVLVADNVGIFADELQPFLEHVRGPAWRAEVREAGMEAHLERADAVAVGRWAGP